MAKKKGEKPGVLLYWETFDMFERATPEKIKIILKAIRNFAQYGEVPDFGDDEALNLVWPQLEQRIVADNERYEIIREQRTNAVKTRWEKQRAKSSESIRSNTDECESIRNIPTTTTSTTTTTTTSTTTNNNIMDESSNTTTKRFKPPAVEDVRAYCKERNNNVDAQQFVDFYEAKGWMLGKNKMKDWKAAVRTWERNDTNGQASRDHAENKRYGNYI